MKIEVFADKKSTAQAGAKAFAVAPLAGCSPKPSL
jgi:hypothetical protein